MTDSMQIFKSWADKPHEYAKEWKEKTGKKVVGYICTYVPEEILYAADILPVRIFGGQESDISIAEQDILTQFCPFCRSCLAQGLKGRYDYLDGVVIAQSCLHMRQVFWAWERHIPVSYKYYIPMPHGTRMGGRYEYEAWQLSRFKESFEQWIGKKITDADLDRGIDICNTNRRLLEQVWEFRKRDNPPITGREAMEIVIASQITDKRECNEALKELLKELPERKLSRETGTRLMIVGSENDDRKFAKLVEEDLNLPATFVIEDSCVGSRYFLGQVISKGNRILDIGKRYLDRPPCAAKDWPERARFPHIANLIREYKVDAVILMQQKFCDPYEAEIPALTKFLRNNHIPVYFLEFDVTIPIGQFRTRVEGFLETFAEIV